MEDETYTLREVSRELGIPTYTVRRFCNAGLIRGIRRKRNGYRILNREQVELLKTFVRMSQVGFRMEEIKKYARLLRQGGKALTECKAMLETQRRQLWTQIEERQKGIDFIERSIEIIDNEN